MEQWLKWLSMGTLGRRKGPRDGEGALEKRRLLCAKPLDTHCNKYTHFGVYKEKKVVHPARILVSS